MPKVKAKPETYPCDYMPQWKKGKYTECLKPATWVVTIGPDHYWLCDKHKPSIEKVKPKI